MSGSRPTTRCPRLALPAAVLGLAFALLVSSASAQQASVDSSTAKVEFDIRFVPQAQRKPVPYERVLGVAVIAVTVEGREVWALLDNGASASLIDQSFARSLDLPFTPVTGGPVLGMTGALERWRVPPVSVVVPGQVGMKAPVFATDLSRISALAGRPITLVIGQEYFDVLVFVFTPRNRQLHLGPSGSLRLPEGTIPIELREGRPEFEAVLAGQPAVLAIDLGYNGEIALNPHAWSRLGLDALHSTPIRSADASGEISESANTVFDEVALGPFRAREVDVALSAGQFVDREGYAGFGLLSRYNFALDLKARRLWLIPPFPVE